MFMLAFKLIANVKREVDDTHTYRERKVEEVKVFHSVFTVMFETKGFSKPHRSEHTHLSTQTHTGALIHCRDYQ